MKTAHRLVLLAATAALVAVLAAGCATNEITGRQQFMMVSQETAISQSAVAYKEMVGDLGKKKQIETGTERARKVQEITDRLVAQAVKLRPDSANWHWEVQVINDPKTVNAFCMAGGKMAIYTGMWDQLHATDEEIAMVMGHEISHALANHTQERMSIAMASTVGLAVLTPVVAPHDRTGLAMTGAAAAAMLAIQLPNCRESESEADRIGIELASKAGFDPKAAVTLWDKMGKLGGSPPEFLSTHPSPEHREEVLRALGAKMQPYYEAARANPAPSQRFVNLGTNERVAKPAPSSSN